MAGPIEEKTLEAIRNQVNGASLQEIAKCLINDKIKMPNEKYLFDGITRLEKENKIKKVTSSTETRWVIV